MSRHEVNYMPNWFSLSPKKLKTTQHSTICLNFSKVLSMEPSKYKNENFILSNLIGSADLTSLRNINDLIVIRKILESLVT